MMKTYKYKYTNRFGIVVLGELNARSYQEARCMVVQAIKDDKYSIAGKYKYSIQESDAGNYILKYVSIISIVVISVTVIYCVILLLNPVSF